MRIGYACICIGGAHTNYRTCTQKYATSEKLIEIIEYNLQSLATILQYNLEHDIMMYRITSDLIPFGSSPVNTLDWQRMFQKELRDIGKFIKQHQMRVSLHPGQYSVLNSPRAEVVERAIDDLVYHTAILDAMELDATHKMILHVGGVYGDKEAAMERFVHVYKHLPDAVLRRLVVENDDHYYHIEDVLHIATQIHVPIVFDNLHNHILQPMTKKTEMQWLDEVRNTWDKKDGIAKIHYCIQDNHKRIGAHAFTIQSTSFLLFLKDVDNREIDIMLEVKDKNLSALKCLNLKQGYIEASEEEWQRYHYVLYLKQDKFTYWKALVETGKVLPALPFYSDIETIYEQEFTLEDFEMLAAFIYQEGSLILKDKDKTLFTKQFERFMAHDTTWEKLLELWLNLFQRKEAFWFIDALFPLVNTVRIEV